MELADTLVLETSANKVAWGFESLAGHHFMIAIQRIQVEPGLILEIVKNSQRGKVTFELRPNRPGEKV